MQIANLVVAAFEGGGVSGDTAVHKLFGGELILCCCARWYLLLDGIDVAGVLSLCGLGAGFLSVEVSLQRGVALLTVLYLCVQGCWLYGGGTGLCATANGCEVGNHVLLAKQ